MEISDNIRIIDLALYVENNLILSDFHIGFEEALNKQGFLLPRFQFEEIIKKLDKIFLKISSKNSKNFLGHKKSQSDFFVNKINKKTRKKTNKKLLDKIIVNGDLKHEFGTISEQEWRLTLRLLDYLGKYCNEIILIKGNHDTILGPIAKKRNVKILNYYLINEQKSIEKKPLLKKSLKKIKNNKKSNKNILITHGDKIPNKDLLKNIGAIIIGHEHPAVSIKEGPRVELFKCFLRGKYKNKNLIVQPSFNLVTEGTDLMKEKLLSPFLHQSLNNFEVYAVADKVYRFGRLGDL